MTLSTLGVLLALLAANPAPETAADSVTLRDGKVVLGQWVEPSPRGAVAMIVRRAWAEVGAPELLRRSEADEAPALKRALRQRRERLAAWKRERSVAAEPDDRIMAWIDQEQGRLADGGDSPKSPLMVVKFNRGDVRGAVHRPKASARLLRLGWRSGFPHPETMSLEGLKGALEGRGFDPSGTDPVVIDDLLPVPAETDDQWLARRAATEVNNDAGLKFIRVGPMVIPEPAPGQPLGAGVALGSLPDLSKLLDGRMPDPLPERLREVSARGRVGALVTQQDMSPELDAAKVLIAFWVRRPDGRWVTFGSRSSTVRVAELKGDEIKALASDEQVQAVFQVVKSLGLGGDVGPDVKAASLGMGAATRKALGQAREAIGNDLMNLALPLERPK